MEKNRELHSRRDDMQTQNCNAQIQEIVRLKKALQVKHDLRHDDKASKKFFSIYNYCLNSLKSNFREILLKSYFNVSYKFWWVDKYSQSAYYRRRAKAVISFVNLFNLIYENFSYFSRNVVCNSK